MNTKKEKKTNEKSEFEPVKIKIMAIDTKTDIICTSPEAEEGDSDSFNIR